MWAVDRTSDPYGDLSIQCEQITESDVLPVTVTPVASPKHAIPSIAPELISSWPLETRRGSGDPHTRTYVWKTPPSSFQPLSRLGLRLSKLGPEPFGLALPRPTRVNCAKVNPSHQSILDSSLRQNRLRTSSKPRTKGSHQTD